jgi:hypothetical protein
MTVHTGAATYDSGPSRVSIMLARIVAPHFVAGIILGDDRVVDAAPIVGYMRSCSQVMSWRRAHWDHRVPCLRQLSRNGYEGATPNGNAKDRETINSASRWIDKPRLRIRPARRRRGRIDDQEDLSHSSSRGVRLQLAKEMIVQRLQLGGRCADPMGERRAVDLDALTRQDLSLPVQRKMICVLAHHQR